MGWEGTDDEEVYPPDLPRVDPFPFTSEGRLYQRVEHELALAQAVLRVGALVLEKQAITRKRRARKRDFPPRLRDTEGGVSTPFATH
jgi:hypothetical protein